MPDGVSRKKKRSGRCCRPASAPGRDALEKDKSPILGSIQREGQVLLYMLANVRQKTIRPIITGALAHGTLIHTDEHGIYAPLKRRDRTS